MNKVFRNVLILSALLLVVQCQKDCDVVYTLQDRNIYEVGDSLIYLCSDGTSDTLRVEKLWYSNIVEEYSQGIFSDQMCTYSFQECNLYLQSLNSPWETVEDNYFSTSRINTCEFMIRYYGTEEEEQNRSCSYIGSGNEEELKGYIAEDCFDGLTGSSSSFKGKEYHNVFSYEIFIEAEEGLDAIHYRIYWNLTHGIIRFENVANNPVISWDLEGKLNSGL